MKTTKSRAMAAQWAKSCLFFNQLNLIPLLRGALRKESPPLIAGDSLSFFSCKHPRSGRAIAAQSRNRAEIVDKTGGYLMVDNFKEGPRRAESIRASELRGYEAISLRGTWLKVSVHLSLRSAFAGGQS
jgi:hypothetical protein